MASAGAKKEAKKDTKKETGLALKFKKVGVAAHKLLSLLSSDDLSPHADREFQRMVQLYYRRE